MQPRHSVRPRVERHFRFVFVLLVYVFEQADAQARSLSVLLRFHYMFDACGDVADNILEFVMCTAPSAPLVLVWLVATSD